MKNYNKILEAVNRGIQLALDDFDDEEQVVYASKGTKAYFDMYDENVSENSDAVPYFFTTLLDEYHSATETNEEAVNEAVVEAVAEELAMPF